MCGIVGILNLDGRPAEEIEVRAMMEAVKHRGPDGEGLHLALGGTCGKRWDKIAEPLAILGLE